MDKKLMGFVSFLCGLAFYFLIAIMLTGYDNATQHKTINSRMVDFFKLKLEGGEFSSLANYQVDFEKKLVGKAITQPSNTSRIEGDMTLSVKEWLIHGGYSADEPEGWQALRHFYDPMAAEGIRYLTDIYSLQEFATWTGTFGNTTNPKIDAVEWALEDQGQITEGHDQIEQLFSWSDAKTYLRKALEAEDVDKKELLMVSAWRAVGETIHLFSDMACPVHVRNDGHPPLISSLERIVNFWGDPDPYENGATSDTLSIGGHPNHDVINEISRKSSVRKMFHKLATFTSNNFFTNQTIAGTASWGTVKPVIRPEAPYALPKLAESGDGWSYDEKTYNFYKKVGDANVLMCNDAYYFGTRRKYPRILIAGVFSQASVLIPTVVQSAPYIVARFFPDLKIELTSVDDETLTAMIVHTTNSEYDKPIIYNGPIVAENRQKAISYEGECQKNKCVISDIDPEEIGRLDLSINFGGITLYTPSATPATVSVTMQGDMKLNGEMPVNLISFFNSRGNSDKEAPRLKWDKNRFNAIYHYSYNLVSIGKYLCTSEVKGEFNEDHKSVETFTGDVSCKLESGDFSYKSHIVLENVPIENEGLMWSKTLYGEKGAAVVKELTYQTRSFDLDRNEVIQNLTSVNWEDPSTKVDINFTFRE